MSDRRQARRLRLYGTLFLTALATLSIQACSLIFQGHSLDDRKIATIQPGVTTEQELIDLLGRPEAIVYKKAEETRIYQYKNLRGFTLGLPFVVSVGRTKQNGRVLNVTVKDGRVLNYEDTAINEGFLWR